MSSTRNSYVILLAVVAVAFPFRESVVLGCDAKDKLVKDLLQHYLTSVEPDDTVLKAGLAFTCSRYDRTKQELTSSVWEKYSWTDKRLRWNPKDYKEIATIRVPSKHIWTPDFKLYNSLLPVEERDMTLAVISHEGGVIWIPTALYKTPCNSASGGAGLSCQFITGSWTYDSDTLKLEMDGSGIDLTSYMNDTCPLTVDRGTAELETKYYPCCTEPYSSIKYTVHFKP